MKNFALVVASLAMLACLVGVGVAAEFKSGPQVGENLAGPFHPLNINGAKAGQKHCLYCENGGNPVAMVFARDCNAGLVTLMKQIDTATAKNKEKNMGSFVVFLSDSDELTTKLKDVCEKQGFKHTVLSVDTPAGPRGYKVDKDADITVVLYKERNVKANYAFKKGEMKEKDIETIVNAIPKILE
jgi:hypothetical protein